MVRQEFHHFHSIVSQCKAFYITIFGKISMKATFVMKSFTVKLIWRNNSQVVWSTKWKLVYFSKEYIKSKKLLLNWTMQCWISWKRFHRICRNSWSLKFNCPSHNLQSQTYLVKHYFIQINTTMNWIRLLTCIKKLSIWYSITIWLGDADIKLNWTKYNLSRLCILCV